MANIGVHTGHIGLATAQAPANQTGHLPDAVHFAHQTTAAVALASILALLTASTDHGSVQLEAVAQFGAFEHALAQFGIDDGQIHLHEDTLVLALMAESILAPSTDEASMASEGFVWFGHAGG